MANAGEKLLATFREIRHAVAVKAAPRIEQWRSDIERPEFAPSAANLAHYLAFQHHDLRGLQRELMRRGLSSLGRLESRVLVNLATVEAALKSLVTGKPTPPGWPASSEEFFAGEARLRANARSLFGGLPGRDTGRILVTLSTEAAEDPTYSHSN
jgi:pyruvate kinase